MAFSWVDILLSPVEPIYISRTSLPVHLLGLQTAPSRRCSTRCTRMRKSDSPSFSIRDGGLHFLYLGPSVCWATEDAAEGPYPCAVESGRRRQRAKDSSSLSLSLTPRGSMGPTFDLYRPLSIFCNLLLRILNVRIVSDPRAARSGGSETRRQRQNAAARHQQHHQQQFLLPSSPWGDAALIFPRIFSFLPAASPSALSASLSSSSFRSRRIILSASSFYSLSFSPRWEMIVSRQFVRR